MYELPEAIPSRSGGVRTGRDAGRPSKSRSDRTSVRAVNPAKAINVQTFFSCMDSTSSWVTWAGAQLFNPDGPHKRGLSITPYKGTRFQRTVTPTRWRNRASAVSAQSEQLNFRKSNRTPTWCLRNFELDTGVRVHCEFMLLQKPPESSSKSLAYCRPNRLSWFRQGMIGSPRRARTAKIAGEGKRPPAGRCGPPAAGPARRSSSGPHLPMARERRLKSLAAAPRSDLPSWAPASRWSDPPLSDG